MVKIGESKKNVKNVNFVEIGGNVYILRKWVEILKFCGNGGNV